MTPVFFYGLFMDPDLLRRQGLNPSQPIIAYIEDYQLAIGERATLIPAAGDQAYGTVMSLAEDELTALYSDPGVSDYRPEPVTAITLVGDRIAAMVYNLPVSEIAGQNADYLRALIETAKKTGLPVDYIARLEQLAGKT